MSAGSASKNLIFLSVTVLLAVSILFAPVVADPADHYGYGLRVTARFAFAFFLLAYIARPWVQIFGNGRWLVRNRRYLGLAAAIAHTVHFVYIVLYFRQTGEAVEPITIIFGGLAYVLFWMMAATSNNFSMRLLGRWWKRLHIFGMHYIWLIFFQSWVGGALEASWYWGFVVVAMGGLGLRIFAWFKHRAMAVPAGA